MTKYPGLAVKLMFGLLSTTAKVLNKSIIRLVRHYQMPGYIYVSISSALWQQGLLKYIEVIKCDHLSCNGLSYFVNCIPSYF